MNLFIKAINTGTPVVNEKMTLLEIRLIKLTNIFNIFFIFIVAIPAIVLINVLDTFGFQSYIRFILLIPGCTLNITLNYFHLYLPAKIFTVTIPFFTIFFFPIINQFIHAGFFLWFPYGIMIVGAISFFIFSYEKEKNILNLSLLFFAAASIFYDRIIIYAIPNNLDLSFIYGDNYIYHETSKIILLFFLYSALYIAKITAYENRKDLDDLNRKLDQKNYELNYLNINLENIIKERTSELDFQNKRIKELTYTNSHKIRALVARILGIINISTENICGTDEQKFYYNKIQEQAHELNEETKEISKKLSEEY